MDRVLVAIVLAITAPPAAQPATTQPATTQPLVATKANFSFIQISDSHLNPHPASLGKCPALRGQASIRWCCTEAAKPQHLEPFGITAPAPSFAIHTGDITEYGVIDQTWKDVELAFGALPVPIHYVPGNHDNTWVAMRFIMRKKYGAPHYSFDKFGCHFIGLSSATLQEPVPSFDAATMYWLRKDLQKVGTQTPVFIFFHHPPDSKEFAQPAEWARLRNHIRKHNVVLLLYGHGHGVGHKNFDGIDGVMGGSTFGQNAGYNIISVKDGTLRVAYRFFDKSRPMLKLLEKPLKPGGGPTLSVNMRQLEMFTVRGKHFSIKPKLSAGARGSRSGAPRPRYHVTIDGNEVKFTKGKGGTIRIPTAGLAIGGHTLIVRARDAKGTRSFGMRSARFFFDDRSLDLAWRRYLPASVKAQPLVVEDSVLVAVPETGGTLRAINRSSTVQMWEFRTGGAILGSPAYDQGDILFGSGDGHVYRVTNDGSLVWKYDAGAPVYGSPIIADQTVYVGDNSGRLHALDSATGQAKWVFKRATYAIESRPAIMGDRVLFGAWDGYLHCVNRNDGSLVWKSLGPKSAQSNGNRYYAPADCGPVVLDGRIFVCDRGYLLASYSPDGKLGETIATGISAIAAADNGRSFYARGLEDRLIKFDAGGRTIWEAKVPAGRLPVPPTERDGRVYICSNTGLLSVLDAETGSVLWQYKTTPGFYVMAPVAVDANGYCYVIGMEGGITRLRGKRPPRKPTD